MQNLSSNLLTEWRKLELPFSDKTILVAVSGGADSCALAYTINDLYNREKLNHKFIVVHFNHKLRGEKSDADAKFVQRFAKHLDFEFITESAIQGEINDTNIEESARIARYNFFKSVAHKTNSYAVLTAHTMNDQAETFLLNLIRGSGIDGLSAMQAVRNMFDEEDVLLVRPFLSWAKREEIEEFVNFNKIEFRNDSMNEDKNFKRVQIRKELIPLLKSFNPKIVETISKSSEIVFNESKIIGQLLSENSELQELINSEAINVMQLRSLTDSMLYRIIREWCLVRRGNLRRLEQKHFAAIKNLVHSRKSGRLVELPGFEIVKKENGNLIFQDAEVEK